MKISTKKNHYSIAKKYFGLYSKNWKRYVILYGYDHEWSIKNLVIRIWYFKFKKLFVLFFNLKTKS